jgi:hypothetical protein
LLVGGLFVLLHKEQRLRNGILLVCLLLVDVLVVNHYVGMQNLIDSEARHITGQAPGSVFQAALWQRESVYRNGVGFGASVGIVALLMHSFADFNLQIPANAATYVVLCAIAVIGNNHYRERRARTRD